MAGSTPGAETASVAAARSEPSAADVFISFGSDDLALARELRTHLEAGGYTCWMAPDDVSGPKTWAEQIVDAIAASKVVLVVISATANQSTHVSKEVDLALEHAKAVLPVRVEDVVPSGALKYLLALAQWIDAFPGPLGPHADEVRRRVAAIVGAGPAAGSPIAPPASTPNIAPAATPLAPRRRRPFLVGAALGVAATATVVGLLIRGGETEEEAVPAYDEYVAVTDDTGVLTMNVPVQWSDVNGTAWERDGAEVGPAVAASVDLEDLYDTWETPGVFFGASIELAAEDENALLDGFDFSEDCEYGGREPYEDALYRGSLDVWENCGGLGTQLITLVAFPETRAFVLLLQIQVVSEADQEALDTIRSTFVCNL